MISVIRNKTYLQYLHIYQKESSPRQTENSQQKLVLVHETEVLMKNLTLKIFFVTFVYVLVTLDS